MEQARIQILIPALNNAEEIETTFESIWKQDFEKENIYVSIMDFGSTDGTYEKLLGFDKYHFGLYRNRTTQNPRLMLSHMARMAGYVNPGGHYCFSTVLYPGDVLYPDYMRMCSELMIRRQELKPRMVICETDLWDGQHTAVRQPPLFSEDRVIDGYHDLDEYARGYQHQVQCMSYGFSGSRVRFSGTNNEQRWWNKCVWNNYEQLALYIKEPLLCQKRVRYDNELEEILLRWENIVGTLRGMEAKYGKTAAGADFPTLSLRNTAEYALWRSWHLAEAAGTEPQKAAEDCFMIAGVIAPEIMSGEPYQSLERLVMNHDDSVSAYLKDYFASHGLN